MKYLPYLLIAALAILVSSVPARAFDKDAWKVVEGKFRDLKVRMHNLDKYEDLFGADRRLHDELGHFHVELADLADRVEHHGGDPTDARKMADNLSDEMFQVETEYRDHARHVERSYPQ